MRDAAALWRADLERPDAPAELIGTIKQPYFNGLVIGGDGRYYGSTLGGTILVYSLSGHGFELVREIRLPEFKNSPNSPTLGRVDSYGCFKTTRIAASWTNAR
jgi:hypothetical protein